MDTGLLSAGGIGVTAAGLWAGAQWLIKTYNGRNDRREKLLDEREALWAAQRDNELGALREELTALKSNVENLRDKSYRYSAALHILLTELRRLDPESPVLLDIARILGEKYSLYWVGVPAEMCADVAQAELALHER